jgi:hypothetical protein
VEEWKNTPKKQATSCIMYMKTILKIIENYWHVCDIYKDLFSKKKRKNKFLM